MVALCSRIVSRTVQHLGRSSATSSSSHTATTHPCSWWKNGKHHQTTREFSRQRGGNIHKASHNNNKNKNEPNKERLDQQACLDLFEQFAVERGGERTLDCENIRELLVGIGEEPKEETIRQLFEVADADHNGFIDVQEFLEHADTFMGGNPARIILIVGGPGSGKGMLSKRLEAECNVVHLSSGDLLRSEVERGTALGRQVRDIMSRGELVSSAIMVALMKKRMRDHPGKRVLLDGFPRSVENAEDLRKLCGRPELALHLTCDDTYLMERIMGRGASAEGVRREDDNFQTAIHRLRTYHKFHNPQIDWLREQHVPIVNLDCSGSAESVWQQLVAIGRLMRPAVKSQSSHLLDGESLEQEDWSNDPARTSSF